MSVIKVVRALRNRPTEELQAAARDAHAALRGRPSAGVTRPLLIGQAPGPHTHPDLPLFPEPRTSAGGRLFAMTGLTYAGYCERFDRVNLLYTYFGKAASKTEDRFPEGRARSAAEAMRPFLVGRDVLMVGRDVAVAFGHEDVPWLEWRRDPIWNYRYALLPHPSGRNHWYNNSENKAAATQFLQTWVAFSPPRGHDDTATRNGDHSDAHEPLTDERERDPRHLQHGRAQAGTHTGEALQRPEDRDPPHHRDSQTH